MKTQIITLALAAIVLVAGTAVAVKTYVEQRPAAVQGTQTAYAGNANSGPAGPGAYSGRCGVGPGRGSCCATSGPGGAQGVNIEALKKAVADYYTATYNETAFDVEVKDFGCHQEAYIIKDGQPVKRLSINGGAIYEIG